MIPDRNRENRASSRVQKSGVLAGILSMDPSHTGPMDKGTTQIPGATQAPDSSTQERTSCSEPRRFSATQAI